MGPFRDKIIFLNMDVTHQLKESCRGRNVVLSVKTYWRQCLIVLFSVISSSQCQNNLNDSFVRSETRSFEIVFEPASSDADFSVFRENSSFVTSFYPGLNDSMADTTYGVVRQNETHLNRSYNVHWGTPITYSDLFSGVAATLSAVIFVFGLLGNILVVIVIARTRSMHTTTNCYLLSLAVADSLVLLSATLPSIPEPFFRVNEWPYGRAMCPILIFLQYLGVDSSSLSITAFTIERYIAICHPMRAQTMCTVSRAKKIIAILWIITLLYCSPWLGLTVSRRKPISEHESMETCYFRLARSSYVTLYMIDLIVFYVIPLLIATVLYLLIGRILYLSRTIRKNERVREKKSPKRRADSRAQVVRMLVVVVVTFASLWMPYRVMVVYNSFASTPFNDIWFLLFARTMVYVNCAINPVLYNIMSVKFKRAFRSLLSCCPRRHALPATKYSDIATDTWATKRRLNSFQTKPGGPHNGVKQNYTLFHRRNGHMQGEDCEPNGHTRLIPPCSPLNGMSGQGTVTHQTLLHQNSQESTTNSTKFQIADSSSSRDTAEHTV